MEQKVNSLDGGMLTRWFIPVNIIISATLGCLVGCIVVMLIKPPAEFRKFTIIAVGIGRF